MKISFLTPFYGIMHHGCGDEPIIREKIVEVLGGNFFNELKEIKEEIKLHRTLFGYFNRCFKLNKVLAKHNYFLKFFERRDMYRFLIKKKVQRKNEVTRNLSSSALEKFNGYEMIRNDLSYQEKAEVIPIGVVYEPIYDENVPVHCYFTSEIHSAYRSYTSYFDKEKEEIKKRTVRQCHYCQNFLAKNKEQIKNICLFVVQRKQ